MRRIGRFHDTSVRHCVAMIAAPWQPYCDRQLNNVDFASKYEYYRSLLHCALNLASQSTQCIVIGPVCVCVCGFEAVCLFVGLLPRYLEIACIHPHQTGFVGKGSDHLQLIKFWPSRAPGKGVCGGAKIFGSPYSQPARSVFCVSLSAYFHSVWFYFLIRNFTSLDFLMKERTEG